MGGGRRPYYRVSVGLEKRGALGAFRSRIATAYGGWNTALGAKYTVRAFCPEDFELIIYQPVTIDLEVAPHVTDDGQFRIAATPNAFQLLYLNIGGQQDQSLVQLPFEERYLNDEKVFQPQPSLQAFMKAFVSSRNGWEHPEGNVGKALISHPTPIVAVRVRLKAGEYVGQLFLVQGANVNMVVDDKFLTRPKAFGGRPPDPGWRRKQAEDISVWSRFGLTTVWLDEGESLGSVDLKIQSGDLKCIVRSHT